MTSLRQLEKRLEAASQALRCSSVIKFELLPLLALLLGKKTSAMIAQNECRETLAELQIPHLTPIDSQKSLRESQSTSILRIKSDSLGPPDTSED